MTPPRRPPPAGFEVRHKPPLGRWRVLATAATRDEAVAAMFRLMDEHRGGGWHVRLIPAVAATPARG